MCLTMASPMSVRSFSLRKALSFFNCLERRGSVLTMANSTNFSAKVFMSSAHVLILAARASSRRSAIARHLDSRSRVVWRPWTSCLTLLMRVPSLTDERISWIVLALLRPKVTKASTLAPAPIASILEQTKGSCETLTITQQILAEGDRTGRLGSMTSRYVESRFDDIRGTRDKHEDCATKYGSAASATLAVQSS